MIENAETLLQRTSEELVRYGEPITIVLLTAFALCALLMWWLRWRDNGIVPKPLADVPDLPDADLPRVSIIVPYVERQGDDLEELIPVLLDLEYPALEVLAVKCTAEKDADDVMEHLQQSDARVRTLAVPPTSRGLARLHLGITLAVRAARAKWAFIVTPESRLSSPQLLRRMMQVALSEDLEAVEAYANYLDRRTRESHREIQHRLRRQLYRYRAAQGKSPIGAESTGLLLRTDFYLGHCSEPRNLRHNLGTLDLMLDGQPEATRYRKLFTPETTLLDLLPPRLALRARKGALKGIIRLKSSRARWYHRRERLASGVGVCMCIVALSYLALRIHNLLLTRFYALTEGIEDSIFLLLLLTSLLLPYLLLRRSCRRMGERTFGLFRCL